ncbi:hypothetical protein LINPERHAP1_LOCUS13002 [Linum perenne]
MHIKGTDSARVFPKFPFFSFLEILFDELKFPKVQPLIPGVVELRFAIRLLLRVRGDERKRSHIVVLGDSECATVSEEEKSYDLEVLELDCSGSRSCFRASSSCQVRV